MTFNPEIITRYNLYLSHSWNHEDTFAQLMLLLNTSKEYQYNPHFIQEHDLIYSVNERLLYEAIRHKMKHCDVVILMCGVYPAFSKWLNKEIILSKNELNKPLLAVETLGSSKTSLIVRQNADLIVDWNKESIVNAISDLIKRID
jgi:hypothetical protein